MAISEHGLALIREFEGFPYGGRPYHDSVGVWTIGYGHTDGVGPGTPRWTQSKADSTLRTDIAHTYGPAVDRFNLPSQNMKDALYSFVYNLGPGILSSTTTIGRALHRRDWNAVARAILLYDKAGGRRLPGLTRRRRAEHDLFLKKSPTLSGYTAAEVRWIREYDKLVATGHDLHRRRVLRRVMTEQRKRIYRAAKASGWDKANRRARYHSLLARTS